MYQVTREISFCYGHRLLNYNGKCRNLHGHNGKAVITIESDSLDELGMVMDFSDIKKEALTWIDETLDHRMLLHKDDPLLPTLMEMGEPVCIMQSNPTAENIAKYVFEFVQSRGYPVTQVVLWETENCFATYTASKTGRSDALERLAGVASR